MIHRNIKANLIEALDFSPVVLLNGARQTGKSTLAQMIADERGMHYITLDDFTIQQSIIQDPTGFLASYKKPLVIDEVQRVPDLFLAIKASVDKNRKAGRYLLTGSANVLMLPKISESLAGRMVILTLMPFSHDELNGKRSGFINKIYNKGFSTGRYPGSPRDELINHILMGGYPEITKLATPKKRALWFKSYTTTILQRDIRDLANIEKLHEMPHILSLLAVNSSSMLNISNLSRDLGLQQMTLKRYLSLLEATFLLKHLPAYFANINKRLIKAPKLYLNDSGLLSFFLGITPQALNFNNKPAGQMFENYIYGELLKQISWNDEMINLFYFRTTAGKEVDFVLENQQGKLIGIEVKLADSIQQKDFAGLHELAKLSGNRFKCGYVLYTGKELIPFGKNMFCLPASAIFNP